MSRAVRFLTIALVVLGYLPPALKHYRENKTPATFVVSNSVPTPAGPPQFQTELITAEAFVPSVHVGSICETTNGTLCACWYGGSHEGARDVNIYLSRRSLDGKEWSKPQVVVSRASAMSELKRPIKKVGNAVMFADSAGNLRLIYVSITLGGWSTSSLNLKTSHDGGESWSPSKRLVLSPFFNLSELVKNNPSALSDGGWAVPVYHEFLGKFPEILWMKESPAGEVEISKTRVFGGRRALQPALLPLGPQTALALCRDGSQSRRIQVSRSGDVGRHWSAPLALPLPNSDSGLDGLRLSDGRLLLAFNDSESGRENLGLAVSEDDGKNWSRLAVMESETGAEFSYPYLIQSKDGWIHLVYTWKRKSIKHASFNLAWLDAQRRTTYRAGAEL